MRIRYPLVLTLGLLCSAQSQAASFFENPAILGGVTFGQLNIKDDTFPSPSQDPRFTGFDAHSAAWGINVGFEFNRYLSVEVGRMIGGTATQDKVFTSSTATTTTFSNETTDLKTSGWQVSAIGSWPVNEYVSFYARAGMLRWESTFRWNRSDTTVDNTGALPPSVVPWTQVLSDKDGNDPVYGGGIALNIDGGLLRLEYVLSQIRGFDSRSITLSATWRFRPW